MLSRTGRPLAQLLFGPIAKLFVKMGVSANVVTVVGTVLSSTAALTLIPTNHLVLAVIVVTILVLFDNLDGQIARLTNSPTKWGAFLDSTMDRISDAAIFGAVAAWGYFHAIPEVAPWVMSGAAAAGLLGGIVPYARARAEGIGYSAAVGIAERADRLVFTAIAVLLVGLGLSQWILAVGMWILAVLAAVTVIQRIVHVYRQIKADDAST
ncbi:MAG: CDP-alcohol phosphatidyltransferase family protein [Actinomycetaceae bacterium]|nr:CDP-alcohol phosphatidyltransferase family protein [Actinomycetaceae bacterium]